MRTEFSAFCVSLMGPMGTVHGPPRIEKRSHGFCYSVLALKNYFVTIFSVISFQFSVNKQYSNRLLVATKVPINGDGWGMKMEDDR